VQCGAFDSVLLPMGIHRARAYAAVDRALERSRSATRDRERGQTNLFGLFEAAAPKNGGGNGKLDEYLEVPAWDRLDLLARERQALGCYVSGHPLLRYGDKVTRLGAVPAVQVQSQEAWTVITVAGIVENYQEKIFKGGSGKAAFLEIEDMSGRVKAKVRSERIETYGPLLSSGEPVLVSGKVSFPITDEPDEEAEPTILIDEVLPLSDAVRKATRSVVLHLDAEGTKAEQFQVLKALLSEFAGPCPVELILALPEGAKAVLALEGVRVDPGNEILSGLERLFGDTVAELR
jgi:DNA polymerase-3 subunit alpha